jgi:hypothetical protein
VKRRRAGQREAPPSWRPPLEVSTRTAQAPTRFGSICGLPAVVDGRMQTPEFWRATWADELAQRGRR